jgi:hypothetical protein
MLGKAPFRCQTEKDAGFFECLSSLGEAWRLFPGSPGQGEAQGVWAYPRAKRVATDSSKVPLHACKGYGRE